MIIFGRKIRVRYILLGDIFLTIISIFAAYVLRLELVSIFPTYQKSLFFMLGNFCHRKNPSSITFSACTGAFGVMPAFVNWY